ncbi:amine oxidase [Reticulibacter mediterranei]|uniref:Amine oxidase n=1 Tax=Reticulibacter mediterranei TaxID=2778369 RepID=A0A8J3IVC9_9CHLR|nr:NAD(P)/FAD-dependent oxidoreductase [Reticulibacter mediterranei]GHO99238.1 amine oxidase [Reticulibacter mediterranei]
MIVIIGAGLAGLTCAKHLTEAGQQVLVLEATNRVGGRVRTDLHPDGYRLDRGFQVLFTAYPAAQREFDYEALHLCRFAPEVLQIKDGKRYMLADPLRQPTALLADVSNPLLTLADKEHVLRLLKTVLKFSPEGILAGDGETDGEDETTERYLRRWGFAEHGFIEHFARPFFGGIFLDRSLTTSARMFRFVFQMLARGDIVVPSEGMQRLPDQLASSLPVDSIRYQASVSKLLIEQGRVIGVHLASGEQLAAEQVIVATESPVAARLTGLNLPTEGVGCTCLYFVGDTQLYRQCSIVLSAEPEPYVNYAALMTNIAPTYAPPGKHLLSVTTLDSSENDEERMAERCLRDLAGWFPEHKLSSWKFLTAYRIPFAQTAQKPGVFDHLPDAHTPIAGLYLAGEYTRSSSIQGAMQSGADAAKAVLESNREVIIGKV